MSELKFYSYKLNIGMTKSKSSASSVVVPSFFVIHLMNEAQFLNAASVARLRPIAVMSTLIKI